MSSWNALYGLAGVLMAFGALAYVLGNSNDLKKVRQQQQDIAAHGVSVSGRVTQLHTFPMNDATGYNIFYQYSVAGESYEGVADTTEAEYSKYYVGAPITIVYLPNDPSDSDYHPEAWLQENQTTNKISLTMLTVGLSLGVVVGLLDIRRHWGS